ncbi:MAG: Uma2 family endonuclease, partial [Planctomycetes bacterium]|nr:Uma2 family endonuclease [Planctomycetota bacterium]
MATTELPKSFPFQPIRLSVQRYHELTRVGAFTEHDAVELLDGVVVEKMPKNPPHRLATRKCDLLLSQLCPEGWHVQNQEPITLQNSEPEPDIAVIRGSMESFADRHPLHHEVALVIEVADTTLVTDRYKSELYALAGIPVYWLINLVDQQIEVRSKPNATGSETQYSVCKT